MTDTTHPHPEPSEEASSLPVVRRMKLDPYSNEFVSLVRLSDAQSQLNAMRAELERKSDAIQKLWKERDEALAELAALEAAPAVDVEAIKRDARAEALRNFRHEHGQDFSDAKKWREWQEAQRLIEEEMPEGYALTLVCSPGDWDLRFTDPECEDIRIDDYESTEDFIRTAVTHAKEHVRAALASPEGSQP